MIYFYYASINIYIIKQFNFSYFYLYINFFRILEIYDFFLFIFIVTKIIYLFFLILMCGFFKLNNLFYLFIFNLPDNIW